MSRTDQLMSAIQRKFKTPGRALAALGFNQATINKILSEDQMKNRRLARDQGETLSSQESELWFDLLAQLPEDERNELYREFKARVGGEEPGENVGSDRRRRLGRDDPPPFAGRPTPGGSPVGLWDPARDQRRARDGRRPAMDAAGLPTTEEIWPGVAARQLR